MKKIYLLLTAVAVSGIMASAAPARKAAAHQAPAAGSAPVTLPATNVTDKGFTANWKAVPGASCYQVTVFEPQTATREGDYTLLAEDFIFIELGSYQEPYDSGEWYLDLSELGFTSTPDWSAVLPVFARGAVAGIVYSPYIDLTNDDGKFTVTLGITGYAGGQVVVASNSDSEVQKQTITLTTTGYNTCELTFTNGCHDTYLTITDYGIADDREGLYADCYDFLDDIAIEQHLQAGDTYLRLVEVAETPEDSGLTSWDFDEMTFRGDATHLAYDVMAITVDYTDPDDPYEYDIYYSPYSELEHVILGTNGITDAAADSATEAVYYNLQGVRVEGTPAPGLYIRRQGTTATKVLVD